MGRRIAAQIRCAAYLKIIQGLRLMDDDFMKICLDKNIPAVGHILATILPHLELRIIRVKTEYVIPNLYGHGVRLDIYAKDKNGTPFNIEIQRASRDAHPRRARYNASLLDAQLRRRSKSYKSLPDTYVIFITEKDIFGESLPVYEIGRIILKTGASFDDGSHILYVNGAYKGDDPIGHLIHDLRAQKPEDMTDSPLRSTVIRYKETEGGVRTMCKAFEKLRREAAKEANEAAAKAKREAREAKKAKAIAEREAKEAKAAAAKEAREAREAAEKEIKTARMAAEKEAQKASEAMKAAETARKDGKAQGRLELLKELVAAGVLTVSAAAKKFGDTEEAFRKMAML